MRARDALWAVAICLGLNYALHMRPLGQARRLLEQDALEGFQRAFHGRKFVTGEPILAPGAGGALEDKLATPVQARRLNVKAEHLAWNGRHAEFVVQHLVRLFDGSPEGTDVGQSVHVTLAWSGDGWQYDHFEVLGQPPQGAVTGNPWEAALASVVKH
jgi:hypothetical protein